MTIDKISNKIPSNIKHVIKVIEENGFEAYLVGGAVRDILMGKTPHDYDICSSAKAEDIKRIFPHHFALGEKFGTITVIEDEEEIEITTFRKDSTYSDGRRPDGITFTTKIEEDLSRRDFTINAIAFSPTHGLVDPFNGVEDIENEIIKAVGQPTKRFDEDGLRILRAVRFSSKLGFKIEEQTRLGMESSIGNLDNVSLERFAEEFVKILMGPNVINAIKENIPYIQYIIPEFEAMIDCPQVSVWHIYDVLMHTLKVVESIPKTKVLKLAAFFHDFGKPHAKTTDEEGIDHFRGHATISVELAYKVLKRLRFERKVIHEVTTLIEYHDHLWHPTLKSVKKLIGLIGFEMFDKLIELVKADNSAKAPRVDTAVEEAIRYRKQIEEENSAVKISELNVNGREIMNYLEIDGSPIIGVILEELLEIVIDDESRNKKGHLLKEAKMIYNSENS